MGSWKVPLLVGFDGRLDGVAALRFAADLAARAGALVHVVTLPGRVEPPAGGTR